jgi:[amino group carrier protein]-lysine/ornithine hydrolase
VDEGRLLERLVAQYSPSGRERPAAAEFVRIARELGYAARLDGIGNGLARRGKGHPRLLFLGHIDTVEGERPVRRERGVVRGRGAVDAKGPLIAALLAGREAEGPGELIVAAAVGEETDSHGARYLLGHLAPDFVIAGEPSGSDGVTIAYKGELKIEATFRGERTHYSSPWPTTADVALDWIAAVKEFAGRHAGASPFRSLTAKVVGVDSTGRAGTETVRTVLDLRIPPGLTAREVRHGLPTEPGRPEIVERVHVDPIEVERTNPVVLALVHGIRAGGARPTIWRKAGTSDLNLVLPAWKVPGAAYGPGDAKLDHTDREELSETELRRSIAVLASAFRELQQPRPASRL